ncbi:MAG: peptidoglycan-binding lysin domain protein [Halomonas sp. 54_146]|nr:MULTISPECIES: LysM domain-containing protein [unclassified Halomonas]KUJ87720.1 MAG: peptidoglycan-binding lysin domain protein [Halomonas sp. 54_146]HAA44983.1 peptidoglycan-binding protein [Halomonas sp.]
MAAKQRAYRGAFGAWLLSAVMLLSVEAAAWERLRSDAPERYQVVSGDTLWDIAGRFLHAPWQWPQLWQHNPHITNPHLIYPGDVLVLNDCQGTPCFGLERGQNVVKLSPQMRTLPHREAIAPIPMDVARAFLREHRVVDNAEDLQELAYVVAGDDRRLISGAGDRLYVRGDVPRHGQVGIYRQSESYHAMDGTPLGLELINVGVARHVSSEGDIAQLEVVSSHQEVRINDIVLPLEDRELSSEFMPRAPLNAVEGHIIAIPGGVRFIGRFQIVTLDLGTLDGLQAGHVLQVNQQGELINDPRTQELVQLPSTEAGIAMVFKPYDHVSYALVMQASRVLEVGDQVASPAN